MTQSHMSHQKQLDDDGEISSAADRLEQECRETLLNMNRWPIQNYWSAGPMATEQDVTEALYDLCHDEICLALSRMDKGPIEAVRILKECLRKAVEDVLGRMDFEAIVKAISEQECAA